MAQLDASEDIRRAVYRTRSQPAGNAMPRGVLPGTDDRLRALLDAGRTDLFEVDEDRWGLHHQGPDGSVVYTSRAFWGPLEQGYPEIQEDDMAAWESSIFGIPEAPCWTCPECNIENFVTQ